MLSQVPDLGALPWDVMHGEESSAEVWSLASGESGAAVWKSASQSVETDITRATPGFQPTVLRAGGGRSSLSDA